MRKSIVFFLVVFFVALTGGIVVPSAARADDNRGTMEQQMACTPDVWRLCASQIPDVGRIVACLRANTPRLSEGCRAVFASGPPPEAVPQDRLAPPPQRWRAPQPYYYGAPRPYEDDDDE